MRKKPMFSRFCKMRISEFPRKLTKRRELILAGERQGLVSYAYNNPTIALGTQELSPKEIKHRGIVEK